MNLANLWGRIYDKYGGKCSICGITDNEGGGNGVYSIFQERAIDPTTFQEEEFVVFCHQDRKTIQEHFTKSTPVCGIIKKYLVLRGHIAHALDQRRKEAASREKPSSARRTPKRKRT